MNAIAVIGLILVITVLACLVGLSVVAYRQRRAQVVRQWEIERQRADAIARITAINEEEDTTPAVLMPLEWEHKRTA